MLFCGVLFRWERSPVRRTFASRGWLLIGVFVTLVLLPRSAASQFTSFSHDPRNILEGSWQSCRDSDGQYTERVYDHVVNGVGQFEVHLGPRNEFAIFKGVQEQHRAHASTDNLLTPFVVAMEGGRAKQRWEIPALSLLFTATLAGGSRTDCESWFVLLEPLQKTTH
jgi:hypothetical protein